MIKCSPENPISAILITANIDIILPNWLDIINSSLAQGSSDDLESAVIFLLIKVVERLRLHIGRFSALFDDKLKFGTLIEMTKRKHILPGDTPEIHYFAHCDVTKD